MSIHKIHQFGFATGSGSGVTNGMFYTQKILRELGFESQIFARHIGEDLRDRICTAEELSRDPDALLLVHHFLGYDDTDWLFALPNPKVIVYHNITPPELLPLNSEIGHYAELGREQLAQWSRYFIGAIGDSQLNTDELIQHQYLNPAVIPMLVDLEKHAGCSLSPSSANRWHALHDSYNVLFVGRICENKNQTELIEVLSHLRVLANQPVRLFLAGEVTSGIYAETIQQEIDRHGLREQVVLTGKLSEDELISLYRNADAFLCLSKHEGFGMPLIEAMQFGLPVIARESTSVAETLGGAGYLLPATATAFDAALSIATLMREPVWRRSLVREQGERIQRFSKDRIKSQLIDFLSSLAITPVIPHSHASTVKTESWQIEGPFDSSYSLAVVNREFARALAGEGLHVGLRSHEGAGDFEPNSEFLLQDPACQSMVDYARNKIGIHHYPDVALRYCYPPNLNDMPAGLRVVHCYGWEETGYPHKFVEEFNRRLDLACVHSYSVAKHLRDNGVRIPIVVIGGGADHVLQAEARELPDIIASQLKGFRFLHISSCFPRKGVDVLLQAYAQSFSIDDDVSLIIKSFPNPHNQVQELLNQLRANNPRFPHVVLINEDWSQEELIGLYKCAHAFVAPSRGEGFGIPLAEAMFFDLPVITTRWGGQLEFCRDENSWLCDFEFAKAGTHLGLTHSLWAEPKREDLAAKMKDVFQATAEKRQLKTRQAKALVERDFTWRITAQKIVEAVRQTQAQTQLRTEPKIAWISTWNARCGIANYSHFLIEHMPQNRLHVFANHIPERMALDQGNVLRCWNAQQEEDYEYVFENILERGIKAVVIQYNFGFISVTNLALFLQKLQSHQIDAYVFFHSTADVVIDGKLVSLSSIKTTLASVQRLFVHSVDDMNRFKNWGLLDNVVYFPHGVAAAPKFSAPKAKKFEAAKVIASYGFLLPHKGIRQLIEAFAKLDHVNTSYHLLLVNSLYPSPVSAEELVACQSLIHNFQLADRVTLITDFLAEQETLALLSNADLIVFPYQNTQESSSAAVRVGLSTGKPVMVTPLKIFDDVKEAVMFSSGTDSESFLEGIQATLNTEVQTDARLVDRTTWFAERSWDRLANRLLNIIDGIANQSTRY